MCDSNESIIPLENKGILRGNLRFISNDKKGEFKTEYKYIHFIKIEDKPKTSVWSCRNNKSNEELGIIKWYASWRQYCYFPANNTLYSMGCMMDIIDFINELNNLRK